MTDKFATKQFIAEIAKLGHQQSTSVLQLRGLFSSLSLWNAWRLMALRAQGELAWLVSFLQYRIQQTTSKGCCSVLLVQRLQ